MSYHPYCADEGFEILGSFNELPPDHWLRKPAPHVVDALWRSVDAQRNAEHEIKVYE
ncbi:hypothetical protein H1O16_gp317 [Burkholderia phage BcepSaruman]|uniref:Uncharacterized protein n=1 Tax=Burkholderia phage BcepSaruman TaxID=2530032 RepID=A0A4D5ZDF8_9CAUD|nr:hypothetical protein H1O16_gp317 [Burkholderia phage BcepSaruman]QBX06730.1 hypothetical protein BcepSaruman_317 [Burkholderia phage BcepSaruman]